MWLGPAPKRAFNDNRFGVDPKDGFFSNFRWFWDYAGGWMTDWGIHWLDIVQMAFKEEVPFVRRVGSAAGWFQGEYTARMQALWLLFAANGSF